MDGYPGSVRDAGAGAGQPELREKVLEAVHSQQKGPEAEQYALLMATVLEQALLGTIATRDTLAAVELAADAAAKEADGGAARLMAPISDAMERLKELRTGGVEDKIRVRADRACMGVIVHARGCRDSRVAAALLWGGAQWDSVEVPKRGITPCHTSVTCYVTAAAPAGPLMRSAPS